MSQAGNIRRAALAALVLTCCAVVMGCGYGKNFPVEPLQQSLTAYKQVFFSAQTGLAEDISKQITYMEERTVKKLNGTKLFQEVAVGDCKVNCDGTLMVKADITDIKKVSEGARFFLGMFAGSAWIKAKVSLIEASTARVIGTYDVEGNSGSSGFSGGTNSAVNKAVDEIIKIVKENCRQKS